MAQVIAMEEGFDGADRQVRGWYGAKGTQYTEYCTLEKRLETHRTVEKSPVMADMGLRWTGLPVIGPTIADQEFWLVRLLNISSRQITG